MSLLKRLQIRRELANWMSFPWRLPNHHTDKYIKTHRTEIVNSKAIDAAGRSKQSTHAHTLCFLHLSGAFSDLFCWDRNQRDRYLIKWPRRGQAPISRPDWTDYFPKWKGNGTTTRQRTTVSRLDLRDE